MSQSRAGVPEPEEIAGRYQVIQKLGAGAFGTVYKVKDKLLGRMLAIKTIRMEGLAAAGASLEEMLERFKREAQVSSQLKHPNIVTIYDIGQDEGMSYLAMEFLDGVFLDRLISTTGKLPRERAASLAAQVADALDFAHRNNVVHRDIKPANIVVEAGDRVKVTDFGIAKVTESGEHLTMTGSLLGTPSYMSPEQARGGAIDGRSDLFALGCVLYEMLAGKKAFRGESITALIFKIITEEPPPIRELDPDLPDEMVRIITRAMAKKPEDRYQSGREMADDLLAFTRPGVTPTIRQVETPTAPGRALSPTAAPTLKGSPGSPPTLNAPLTISSEPTAVGRAEAPTKVTRPAGSPNPASPPPLEPTRITPPPVPRPSPPSPGPPQRAAAMPAGRAAAPRKSGGGAGLLIGLGLAGVLFMGIAAVGAWYVFLRKPAVPVADAPPTTLPGPADSGVPATEPPAPTLAPTPADSGPAVPVTEPPAIAPAPVTERPAPGPRNAAPATPPPAPAPPRAATGPSTRPAPGGAAGDLSFLDNEEPIETTDGRAAGEALSQKYKSDQGYSSGGNFGTSGRFRQRERNPRPQGPVEMSAIKTMRYVMDNQEAFHKKNNRYGTFVDLFGRSPLDVPHTADSFQRRGYRYNLEVASDGFKVTAMPVQPGPRAFTGDDSGFIRAGLE